MAISSRRLAATTRAMDSTLRELATEFSMKKFSTMAKSIL
jgi:hypothetical protein